MPNRASRLTSLGLVVAGFGFVFAATVAESQGPGFSLAPATGVRSEPRALGGEDDIYCTGYLGDEDESFGYSVIGSEYEVLSPTLLSTPDDRIEGVYGTVDTVKYQLTVGDIVYLDGGSGGGLASGTLLTAVAPGREVRHPRTKERFGRQYDYLGRVRVLSVAESTAIAEIVQSCRGIVVGSRLRLFEPEPVPLARRSPLRPVNLPTSTAALAGSPVIVASVASLVSIGEDHVVFIDRGEGDDVLPGDLFTIYRSNREGLPPIVLGELGVLAVREHSALAKILETRQPIYAGDQLERK